MFFKTLVTAILLQAHRLSSHWANTDRDSHCPKDRVTSLCCSSSCRCPRVLQLSCGRWQELFGKGGGGFWLHTSLVGSVLLREGWSCSLG